MARRALEPDTSRFQVRRSNHSATLTPRCSLSSLAQLFPRSRLDPKNTILSSRDTYVIRMEFRWNLTRLSNGERIDCVEKENCWNCKLFWWAIKFTLDYEQPICLLSSPSVTQRKARKKKGLTKFANEKACFSAIMRAAFSSRAFFCIIRRTKKNEKLLAVYVYSVFHCFSQRLLFRSFSHSSSCEATVYLRASKRL